MIGALRAGLHRFRRRADGAAAVEFALLLPIFAALLIGVVQYGGMVIANQQMHNGVSAGAVYVMRGGTDLTAVQNVALQGWPNPPADAAVSVSQACSCAGVGSACGSLCADGTYPEAFITISATGTYNGLFGTKAMSSSQVIRTE
jgi:Flp pilus assembly pilin Flp